MTGPGTSVHIRPARPDDAREVAPLIYGSGPKELEFLLGDALAVLPLAFTQSPGAFNFRYYTVAEWRGSVVGVMCLSRRSDTTRIEVGLAAFFARHYGLSALAAMRRGFRLAYIVPPPPRDTLFVSQLGVPEAWRGRGLGTRLLRHALERARAESLSRVALDVAVTNPAAQRLYERLGFRVVDHRGWSGPEDVPGQRRMERPVTDSR